jgi:predicted RNA-binding protein YlqC (UPF0109 family)
MAERDQEFLEYIVGAIVDNPEDVKINRTVDERGVLLELSVNPEDMGKIIGKAGATAKAIRTLLRVMGAKNNARFNLKIVEPGEEGSDSSSSAQENLAEEAPAEEISTDDIKSKAREGLEDLDVEI